MSVVAGICVDRDGLSRPELYAVPGGQSGFQARRRYREPLPASSIATVQPASISIDVNHDETPVGWVEHMELDGRGCLWAVATITQPDVDLDRLRHYSIWPEHRQSATDPWTIRSIAVCDQPAMVGVGELHVLPDIPDVAHIDPTRILQLRRSSPHLAALLERAADTVKRRRRGDPITIAGARPAEPPIGNPAYVWTRNATTGERYLVEAPRSSRVS